MSVGSVQSTHTSVCHLMQSEKQRGEWGVDVCVSAEVMSNHEAVTNMCGLCEICINSLIQIVNPYVTFNINIFF